MEQAAMTAREMVETALGPLRTGYVFPDLAERAAAAMELVSGTYALIIDLRHNHGGSPEGVVFWCSYLLPGGEIHLNDIFHADTGETRQLWSLAPIDPEQSTQQMIAPCPASASPRCS